MGKSAYSGKAAEEGEIEGDEESLEAQRTIAAA
jgi:hypothetical protein